MVKKKKKLEAQKREEGVKIYLIKLGWNMASQSRKFSYNQEK